MKEEDELPASLLIALCCGVVGVELTNTPVRLQIIGRLFVSACFRDRLRSVSLLLLQRPLVLSAPAWFFSALGVIRCAGCHSVLAVAALLIRSGKERAGSFCQ